MLIVTLLLATTPLPPDAWSVGSDGSSCVQLEAALAADLANWRHDPDSSDPDAGVFGRVNPANPRQLVLLFSSKRACERLLWAIGEEEKEHRPERPLDTAALARKIEAALKADRALGAAWAKLTEKQRKRLRTEAAQLFGAKAHRGRTEKRIATLAQRKRLDAEGRLRLKLWRSLFAAAFGAERSSVKP